MSFPNIIDEIKKTLENYGGKWNEKEGILDFSATIAERKSFLSKMKLIYTAKMRIDDGVKVVKFSEMFTEVGSGPSPGSGFGDGMSTGFGFKIVSYNTLDGARQGTIKEQSNLLEEEYSYYFDYNDVRLRVKDIVEKAGYKFKSRNGT